MVLLVLVKCLYRVAAIIEMSVIALLLLLKCLYYAVLYL